MSGSDRSASRSKSPDARRERRSSPSPNGGGSRNGDRDRGGGGREEEGVSLLVRNLTFKVNKEDIRAEFVKHGRVRDVYIPVDYISREPRGFAFVEMGGK